MERKMKVLSAFVLALLMLVAPMQLVVSADSENTVFINEVESNDTVTGNDWIEIYNIGTEDVDISGWYITDDKGQERVEKAQEWPIADGTVVTAGGTVVIEHSDVLDNFSLGKNDTVQLCDGNGNVMDSFTYTGHASGTYARVPDGVGEFVDIEPTKNALNIVEEEEKIAFKLVLNEVDTQPDVYVEVINIGAEEMDVTGYEIRSNVDGKGWKFPADTTVASNGILAVTSDMAGMVYSATDDEYVVGTIVEAVDFDGTNELYLVDANGEVVDSFAWSGTAIYENDATAASFGRYPDGVGSVCLMKQTPSSANEWYAPKVVVNEVEQDDGSNPDWVEIYNVGDTAVDISGWYMYDDDVVSHVNLITPVADGTTLEPGKYYIFEEGKQFSFSLGKNDNVTIFNKDGVVIDEFYWQGHAEGVYARIPNGVGEFVDFSKGTKGKENVIVNSVVLNEVQSKGTDENPAWIELANPTGAELSVAGLVIKDSSDENSYIIPENTVISANGFLVLTEADLGFELNESDAVRIFEGDRVIASLEWDEDTNPSIGLYPDMNGLEYRPTREETPGELNKFEGVPDMIQWPGADDVIALDTEQMFLENASGLDFYNDQIYAVDNGVGAFWVFDVAADGSVTYADGFENGKRVRFQKDADDPTVAGPDTEGVAVAGDGYVYFSSERDNHVKGINWNTILQVDPHAEGEDLVALNEWDITDSLPAVVANMGIESIEWISSADVNGNIIDKNTNEVFDFSNYPDAISGGLFFVGLEDNGHIYAYILNSDGTSVQVADIDSKLGGIMALDYDAYENVLWAVADNGYNNRAAKITFNGEIEADVLHVLPPTGVDITLNNEGFAIAPAEYTVNGQRPVYRLADGLATGSFTMGYIDCDYVDDTTQPTEPSSPDEIKPTDPTEPSTGGEDKPTDPSEPSTGGEDMPTDPTEPSTGGEDNSTDSTEPSTGDDTKPSEPVVDKGILGDANGDGKVNIKDATLIQKFAAKLIDMTDDEKLRADVNADNKNNVKDATAIQKFVAKIETGFPIGEQIA